VLVPNLRPSFEVFYSGLHWLVIPPLRCRAGGFGGEDRLAEIVNFRARRITMKAICVMCLSLNLSLVLVTEGKMIVNWITLDFTPDCCCGRAC
jgi:hypothetical protein